VWRRPKGCGKSGPRIGLLVEKSIDGAANDLSHGYPFGCCQLIDATPLFVS
jgi:hypothetical protein